VDVETPDLHGAAPRLTEPQLATIAVLTGADAPNGDDRVPLLLETSLPGVFAAGDVRFGSVKRVASAVGEDAMAVRMVHEHLP
jgi:thioredoxin reductase